VNLSGQTRAAAPGDGAAGAPAAGGGRDAVLATSGLTVRFGGVVAVNDVSLTVEAGRLVGIIGPNGAGKTTFIDAVSGLVRSAGEVNLEGRKVSRWSAHRRALGGIGRTFQSLELFDEFTIEENLLVTAEASRRWSFLPDLVRPRADQDAVGAVEAALARVGLTERAKAYPPELSLGENKLVSIARALAGGARLLLLDEPAAGLNSDDSLELGKTLRELVAGGLTIVLVDHDMGLVLGVCDYIHVLNFGSLIASGTPTEIRNDAQVIDAYLGDDAAAAVAEGGVA
jgi:ABC-type branched-subunit amino acid transport system ATPase component